MRMSKYEIYKYKLKNVLSVKLIIKILIYKENYKSNFVWLESDCLFKVGFQCLYFTYFIIGHKLLVSIFDSLFLQLENYLRKIKTWFFITTSSFYSEMFLKKLLISTLAFRSLSYNSSEHYTQSSVLDASSLHQDIFVVHSRLP